MQEFVVYNKDGSVVASFNRRETPRLTLEKVSANYPWHDVAEVMNGREVRVIRGKVDEDTH